MPLPFTTTRGVEFSDTDAAGIAHFTAYFFFMEQAEHELLRHLGLSVMSRDAESKISWPRVSVRCDFSSAARFEDQVQIAVKILRIGEKSVTYGFEFSCDGRTLGTGETTAVCCRIIPEQLPRSIPIPANMLAKLQEYQQSLLT